MQYSIVVHNSEDYYIQTIYFLDINRGIHWINWTVVELIRRTELDKCLNQQLKPSDGLNWFWNLNFSRPRIRTITTKCASSFDSIYSSVPFILCVILLVSSCVIDAKKKIIIQSSSRRFPSSSYSEVHSLDPSRYIHSTPWIIQLSDNVVY